MSRIAKNPIKISKEIKCSFNEGIFSAKGNLGHMEINVNSNYEVKINDDEVHGFHTFVNLFPPRDDVSLQYEVESIRATQLLVNGPWKLSATVLMPLDEAVNKKTNVQ